MSMPDDPELDRDATPELVRTVAPFLMAQRLREAEAKLAALRSLCDRVAAETPEQDVAVVAVSRVAAILGSEEGTSRG